MADLERAVREHLEAARVGQLNGQVRDVPDARTIRYYATIGLVDKPVAMHGRKALYSTRHLAQVLAIKRFQAVGKSLAEIQAIWPKVDDAALEKICGFAVPPRPRGRNHFWKDTPAQQPAKPELSAPPIEVRIQLAGNVSLLVAAPDGIAITPADIDALRAAAAPLLVELAKRQLTANAPGEDR